MLPFMITDTCGGRTVALQDRADDNAPPLLHTLLINHNMLNSITKAALLLVVVLGALPVQAQGVGKKCGVEKDARLDLANCSRALDRAPRPADRVNLLVTRGMAHWRLGHAAAAAQDATEAIGLDPDKAAAWHLRGLVDAQGRDYRSALPAFDKVVALDPKYLFGWVSRAQVRGRAGDVAGALADLGEALRLEPRNVLVLTQRAAVLRTKGDLQAASADIRAALALAPDSATVHRIGAFVAFDLKQIDTARALADKAVKLGDASGELALLRAQMLADSAPKAALEAASTAIARDPDLAEAYELRAKLLGDSNQPTQGIADLGEVIRLRPNDALPLRKRAWALQARRDFARARLDLDEATRRFPDQFPALRLDLARLLIAQEDSAGAMKALDEALEREPDFPLARSYRAHLRAEAGDSAGAESDRVAAKGVLADYWTLPYREVVDLTSAGEQAKALARLDLALKADPRLFSKEALSAMFSLRSAIHEKSGNVDAAMADIDKAIAQEVDPASSLMRRARLKQRKGDAEGAMADFGRAGTLKPSVLPETLIAQGALEFDRGRQEAALPFYTRAIALSPSCGGCYNYRAWTLFKLNRLPAALEDADKALNLVPDDPAALDTRAHVLEALGRKKEAIAAYRRALALHPNLPESFEGLKRLGVQP